MKVKRVDIRIKEMEIEDGAERVGMWEHTMELPHFYPEYKVAPAELFPKDTVNHYFWEVATINSLTGVKKYLILKPQKEIFSDLLDIEWDRLNKILSKHRDFGIDIGERTTIKNIKSLSWWKRLFNKF